MASEDPLAFSVVLAKAIMVSPRDDQRRTKQWEYVEASETRTVQGSATEMSWVWDALGVRFLLCSLFPPVFAQSKEMPANILRFAFSLRLAF